MSEIAKEMLLDIAVSTPQLNELGIAEVKGYVNGLLSANNKQKGEECKQES